MGIYPNLLHASFHLIFFLSLACSFAPVVAEREKWVYYYICKCIKTTRSATWVRLIFNQRHPLFRLSEKKECCVPLKPSQWNVITVVAHRQLSFVRHPVWHTVVSYSRMVHIIDFPHNMYKVCRVCYSFTSSSSLATVVPSKANAISLQGRRMRKLLR